MITLLKTNVLILFILINFFGITHCQFESFPKSSLLITGGLNAGYFYRKINDWNESFLDFKSGIGYAINSRNVCGINLNYEINNISGSSYKYFGSAITISLSYQRYFCKSIHLDLYSGVGNQFGDDDNGQNEIIVEYKNLIYGINIGKTLLLTDCVALDFTTGFEKYIRFIEKYRPEEGNMKIFFVNFNINFIYYLTNVKHKSNHHEKLQAIFIH